MEGRRPAAGSAELYFRRSAVRLSSQEPPPVSTILPARHQRPFPTDQVIRHDPPGAEAIEMDVVIVGAGPAGLACAIELTRLARQDQESAGGSVELSIAVLEKAGALG